MKSKQLYSLGLFNKSIIQLLMETNLKPKLVISNDWCTSPLHFYRKSTPKHIQFFEVNLYLLLI